MVTALQFPYSILLQEICYDDFSTSFLLGQLRANGHTCVPADLGDDQGVEGVAVFV